VIEQLLPATVAVAESFGDGDETLFPEEEAIVERGVERRRREFATGRACARRALERLGIPAGPIQSGERGEPLWPAGIVGSITHCDGFRACAAAHASDLVTLGIDAEPHEPLPDGLLDRIARPEELRMLGALSRSHPDIHWDRLLFSAKESVFKAWFPLTRARLGFQDAALTIDPAGETFSARVPVPGPIVDRSRIAGFGGRWTVRDGLVLGAAAIPA
jgi:4'-phosphopantetheinyl transferase EntD